MEHFIWKSAVTKTVKGNVQTWILVIDSFQTNWYTCLSSLSWVLSKYLSLSFFFCPVSSVCISLNLSFHSHSPERNIKRSCPTFRQFWFDPQNHMIPRILLGMTPLPNTEHRTQGNLSTMGVAEEAQNKQYFLLCHSIPSQILLVCI